jgi:hypothetical protein
MDMALTREEIMLRRLEQNILRRLRVARARWLPGPTEARTSAERSFDDSHRAHQLSNSLRLPPTRAARQPRSRGVFSADAGRRPERRKLRRAGISIAALAVAIVAIASAVIVGAPAVVMGTAASANPGPAIVGAASVPPAFIEPAKR